MKHTLNLSFGPEFFDLIFLRETRKTTFFLFPKTFCEFSIFYYDTRPLMLLLFEQPKQEKGKLLDIWIWLRWWSYRQPFQREKMEIELLLTVFSHFNSNFHLWEKTQNKTFFWTIVRENFSWLSLLFRLQRPDQINFDSNSNRRNSITRVLSAFWIFFLNWFIFPPV